MVFFSRSRNGQCIQTLSDAQDSISCVCMDDTCIITGLAFLLLLMVEALMEVFEPMIFAQDSYIRIM